MTADVALDVTALGSFTSGSEMLIDSSTNPATGPMLQTISATSPIKLSLNGYSVAIIKLQ